MWRIFHFGQFLTEVWSLKVLVLFRRRHPRSEVLKVLQVREVPAGVVGAALDSELHLLPAPGE